MMAIDTENKRRSASNWICLIPPVPDGTIADTDKQHVAGFYSGIAALSAWTKIVIQGIVAETGEPITVIGKYRLP